MKQKLIFLWMFVAASTAFATNFGYDSVSQFGSVMIVYNPYMIENRIPYPLGTNWKSDIVMPELAEMCAATLGIPVEQFVRTGSDIGVTNGPAQTLAVYDPIQKKFSLYHDKGHSINSMDILFCQLSKSNGELQGNVTVLPDGSTRIDQPRLPGGDGLPLPLALSTLDATDFCIFHGFTGLVRSATSYRMLDQNEHYLFLRLINFPTKIYVEVLPSFGDQRFHEMLESITCK